MKIRKTIEKNGAVHRLSLNAPKGNVLDIEMIEALRHAITEAGQDKNLKVVILEGAGEHFSFGASIPEHQPGEIEKSLPRFHDLFRDLLLLARPMIAVVRGNCLGGGLELAAFCNWTFAAPDARFGLPEVKLGVFAPLGSLVLESRMGRSGAEAMCITGQVLTAEEALEANLVDHIAEDPAAAADAWIDKNLLPLSASALHFATRAVRQSLRDPFLANLQELERMYLREVMKTADATEGISAFLEKRSPRWKNA